MRYRRAPGEITEMSEVPSTFRLERCGSGDGAKPEGRALPIVGGLARDQFAIAVRGHPACAGKVTPHPVFCSPLRLSGGVDAKHGSGHRVFGDAYGIGIDKTDIRCEMPVVVFGHEIVPGGRRLGS